MTGPGTQLPATMRVLRAHQRGGPESLVIDEIPVPQPGPDDLLIAVHAAAITFDELRWDETWSHLPSTPSHEWSGVVVAHGDRATEESDLTIGDTAFGLVPFDRNGAAAEYVVVPSSCAARKPVSLTHVEAAALSLAGLTARQALLDQGAVRSEDAVLVMGASGGVGALAVQLAVGLGGRVDATTYAKDAEYVTGLGPNRVYVIDDPDSARLVPGSYDVVLDTVGGRAMEDAIALVRPGGTYIPLQEPAPADVLAKLDVTGRFFVVTPRSADLAALGAEADLGRLRVTVAASYPLEQGRIAFESGSSRHRMPGKTVLVVRADG